MGKKQEHSPLFQKTAFLLAFSGYEKYLYNTLINTFKCLFIKRGESNGFWRSGDDTRHNCRNFGGYSLFLKSACSYGKKDCKDRGAHRGSCKQSNEGRSQDREVFEEE